MLAVAFDDALLIRKKGDILQIEVMKKALKCAFPYTIPIFAGFWFLGLTYGIYMNVNGFSFIYPMLMSLTIFAGSIEFIAVNMLMGAFDPLQALAMTLMINARHLFYGIAMLDKFRGLGWKKIYLSGATLGGIFGSFLQFSTEGLDFVMTAMFVVIFLEQWLKEKDHVSSLCGLAVSLLCLILFGADQFMVPAMLAILGVLTLLRRPLEKGEDEG